MSNQPVVSQPSPSEWEVVVMNSRHLTRLEWAILIVAVVTVVIAGVKATRWIERKLQNRGR